MTCHCKEKHGPGCGCLRPEFIARALTNFASILMECQSSDEFVKRLKSLLYHVQDRHEWKGGKCEFHPLRFVLVASARTQMT